MDEKLHKKLTDRIEKGTLRSLSSFEGMVDFFSNDYLGLSKVHLEGTDGLHGGTGSRLISGTSKRMLEVEKGFADFFQSEAALHFNSGYDANIGFFSAVPQRGDTVLYDALIHASIRDGIRLSLANAYAFKHNDVDDLKEKLSKTSGTVYVVVESLYSMDGDIAPLEAIAELVGGNVFLVVDEAHACGVYGESGKGLIDSYGLNSAVFARIVTFGKAYGSHGAVILGSRDLITYLLNFARSFIYTTALPESVFERNLAVALMDKSTQLERLKTNLKIFRNALAQLDSKAFVLVSDISSPIQILQFSSIQETRRKAELLQEAGFAVKPIYSPTVPEGQERIRVCIHAFNTQEEVVQLVALLQ